MVWGRSPENVRQLAEAIAASPGSPPPVTVCANAAAAVREADIVCTLTPATEPILQGSWLKPGCHVNAVGCCTPRERELDLEAVSRARLAMGGRY